MAVNPPADAPSKTTSLLGCSICGDKIPPCDVCGADAIFALIGTRHRKFYCEAHAGENSHLLAVTLASFVNARNELDKMQDMALLFAWEVVRYKFSLITGQISFSNIAEKEVTKAADFLAFHGWLKIERTSGTLNDWKECSHCTITDKARTELKRLTGK